MKHRTRLIARSLILALVPAASWAGPVNVNTADAATLAKELDGIGPAKAQAIVDYRQKNGAFHSADDLLKVEGIGERVLEMNKANIRVERAAAPADGKKPAAGE